MASDSSGPKSRRTAPQQQAPAKALEGARPAPQAPTSNERAQAAVPGVDQLSDEPTPTLDAFSVVMWGVPLAQSPEPTDTSWTAETYAGLPCDACHDEAPTEDTALGPIDGRTVGTWRLGLGIELRAGRGYWADLQDLGAARGYARTIGGAAVVLQDGADYTVYQLDYSWFPGTFTRERLSRVPGSVPIDLEPGVVAVFTEDSWLIEPTLCSVDDPLSIESEALSEGTDHHRFQEMIDARGEGFEDHTGTDDDVLAAFEVAMRVLMLDILEDTEAQAAERPGQFDAEYPQILAIAEAIDATEQQLEDLERAHRVAKAQEDCNACHEVASIEGQVEELQLQRAILRLKFPLLSRFEPIRPFLELDRSEQQEALEGEVDGLLTSIASTREHLQAGRLELWTLPPLIDATMRAGGFHDPERRELIVQRAADERSLEMITSLALGVLAVGLGLAAAAATGGLSIALTGAAVAVGVADAAWQTGEYFEDVGLSNTAEDREDSFIAASPSALT